MTKRTKYVKTVEDYDEAIDRWNRRIKLAFGKIDRLQAKRKRLLVKAAKPALLPNLPKSPVDKSAPVETPKAEWVFPEKPAPETLKVTVPVAGTGLAPGAAPGTTVDLDIPTFLRREPPDQEALRAAQAEAKKAKAAAAAVRRKARATQKAEHDAIPKSKRRWDDKNNRWVAD